jgi:ATP-dependent DNA helicase DinG
MDTHAQHDELDEILGRNGRLASVLPGYEHREVQLEMARAVERTLADKGVLLVEAGTGTGKTLAYLVPALLSGLKVVVSTGTRTLQDQLMEHDLPLLERGLGEPVSAACMKGLGNYLCLRRYEEFRQSSGSLLGARPRELELLEDWRGRTETGDRAELRTLPESAGIWSEVHSGSDTRIGPRCTFYADCFVTKMREAAKKAQLVVVNHHLFFADLALRGPHGAAVLPDYDAVIFDEAHLLEDIATDFFGISVSTQRIEVLLRDAAHTLAAERLSGDAARILQYAANTASQFFATLPRLAEGESGRLPLPPELFSQRVREPMFALDNAFDELAGFCKRHSADSEPVAQLARRADQLRDDVALIAEGGGAERIAWTMVRGRRASIGSSPIDIGNLLKEKLFYRAPSVVLTSATLSTGGNFDFIKSRLSLDFGAREVLLASPFDYPKQAALYLPDDLGDPRDSGHAERAAARILELCALTGGGAFVLCTSLRAMRDFAARCRPELGARVLVQGEAPNARLLEQFREANDKVLFATAGFWQGVDVPGQALRLVIIDKLPFDVPSDPLVQARCARLEAAGEKSFMKYLVPAAALTLKQGFGRLIRTRHDRGIVALLDGRVSSKGYGKVFLRSLPDATRCRSMPELEAFWR